MPMMEPSSKSHPPLWPSLLIAGILAIVIPIIYFLVADPFGLTLVLLPIHSLLLFGIIWPIEVAVQGPVPGSWLQRHKVATVLFLTSIPAIALMVKMETRNAPTPGPLDLQKQEQKRVAQDALNQRIVGIHGAADIGRSRRPHSLRGQPF